MKKISIILILFINLFYSVNIFAQDNFNNKKYQYQESFNNYLKSRSEYISFYNQYRSECIKNNNNCEKYKEQILEKIKNYFKNSILTAVFYLELTKIRIENSQLDNNKKEILLQKIDSLMTSFNQSKEMINKINNSSDVKNLSFSLKKSWIDAKEQIAIVNTNIYFLKVQQQNKIINNFFEEIENYIIKLGQDKDISFILSKYKNIKSSLLELNSSVELLKKDNEIMTYENYNNFRQKIIDYKDKELQIINNLRQIVLDIKNNDFSKLSKNESEIIEIKGEGKIILNGIFEIVGNISDSGLSGEISASSSDEVDIYNTGQILKNGDSVLYKKVGKFKINSKKTVEIKSNYLDVTIKGKGDIKVIGLGLYKLGNNGSWLEIENDNFEVSI